MIVRRQSKMVLLHTNFDIRGQIFLDKVIDLRHKFINDEKLLTISKSLEKNRHLQSVDLRDNVFCDKNLQFLLNSFANSKDSLEEIYLGYNDIGGHGLAFLLDSNIYFGNLRRIYINNCSLNDEDLCSLCKFLCNNTKVETLDLSCNNFSYRASITIAKIIENCKSLKSFYFSYNKLTSQTIEFISNSLEKNPTVSTIYARCLDLKDQGADLLTRGLNHNTNLKYLNIGDNDISDAGFIKICNNLVSNTGLHTLNLGRNKIAVGSMSALGKLFISNKTLKEINLGKNNISDDGIKILNETIGNCQIGLHMFNVRDNNISEKSANDFASFLKHCQNLRILSLCDNSVGSHGMEIICESIFDHSNLKYLYVSDNDFSESVQGLKTLSRKGVCLPFFVDRYDVFALKKPIEQHAYNKVKINVLKCGTDVKNVLTNYLNNSKIFSICFDEMDLSDQDLVFIGQFIKNHSSIEAVSFQKNQLNCSKIKMLAPSFKGHPSLKIIDFKHNELGKEGTKVLAQELDKSNTLEFIDLSYNYVGFEFIEEICNYHKLSRLCWKF